MQASKNTREILGFLLFAGIGCATVYLSIGYDIGSPSEMGAGFFPFILGGLLIVLALANLATGWRSGPDDAQDSPPGQAGIDLAQLRLLLIPVSLVIFALALEPLGVFVATVSAILAAAAAHGKFRPGAALVLGLVIATLSVLTFRVALGLPMPVWPYWFN